MKCVKYREMSRMLSKSEKTQLVVALDFSNPLDADRLLISLGEAPVIYKVGLELFMAAGPEWVKRLTEAGKKIFLDLKFYDIPNTVAKAVSMACNLNVDYTTVHLSGGPRMFEEIQKQNPQKKLKILGVSVLTSFDDDEWSKVVGAIAGSNHESKSTESLSLTQKSAYQLAEYILQSKKQQQGTQILDGIVCSPFEIEVFNKKNPDLFLMVPGIRPLGSPQGDQKRVMTPQEASKLGANAIVVGRPITKDSEPAKVVQKILKDLDQ